jgi:hypothetical protein
MFVNIHRFIDAYININIHIYVYKITCTNTKIHISCIYTGRFRSNGWDV